MPKMLVAYFTWSQTSFTIAKAIHDHMESDLFEIKTVKKYPKTYAATVMQSGLEKTAKSRPVLVHKVEDMRLYQTIVLIYPNWWGTAPMPICTFLEQYDLKGKKIIPICLNEGSGLGKSMEDIKRILPDTIIAEGLSIFGKLSDSEETKQKALDWVKLQS